MMGESVHVDVTCCVVGLAARVDDIGDGRKADEEVDAGWEENMKVSGALGFRLDGNVLVFEGHMLKDAILLYLGQSCPHVI